MIFNINNERQLTLLNCCNRMRQVKMKPQRVEFTQRSVLASMMMKRKKRMKKIM